MGSGLSQGFTPWDVDSSVHPPGFPLWLRPRGAGGCSGCSLPRPSTVPAPVTSGPLAEQADFRGCAPALGFLWTQVSQGGARRGAAWRRQLSLVNRTQEFPQKWHNVPILSFQAAPGCPQPTRRAFSLPPPPAPHSHSRERWLLPKVLRPPSPGRAKF